jgi:transposase-like protein
VAIPSGWTRDHTEERRDRIAELTRQGWSVRQIAAELGCNTRTVNRGRRARGVTQPATRRMTADEIARGEAMIADGCSLAEIGRTLGRPVTGESAIRIRWAGQGWTPEQTGQYNRLRSLGSKILG